MKNFIGPSNPLSKNSIISSTRNIRFFHDILVYYIKEDIFRLKDNEIF